MSNIKAKLKQWAAALKTQTLCLYLAYKHPDTPWHARALLFLVLAYALSPLDLIPDFVPVLGYLDDLVVLPLGIWLAMQLIPAHVMEECRQRAKTDFDGQQALGKHGTRIVILAWIGMAAVLALIVWLVFYQQQT